MLFTFVIGRNFVTNAINMVEVIQVYKSRVCIEKSFYTPSLRKELLADVKLVTQSGYSYDKTLYLTDTLKQTPGLLQAEVVLLSDYCLPPTDFAYRYNPQEIHCFNHFARIWNFDIFSLNRKAPGNFELSLKFLGYGAGYPLKTDQAVGKIQVNKNLRFSMNGQSFSSEPGEQFQRNYIEYDYFFRYLGAFDDIIFSQHIKSKHSMSVTFGDYQWVDERRKFY